MPIFRRLAETGLIATLLMSLLAVAAYPLAYRRRTRQLVEGAPAKHTQNRFPLSVSRLLNMAVRGNPERSAIFNFISQTLLGVQRYRIYLVMYGGLGVALLIASILRLNLVGGVVRATVSSEGLQIAVPIVAFWTIAGLHMAFFSPSERSGSWVFRAVVGKPRVEHLRAARMWALLWGLVLTLGTVILAHVITPRGWEAVGIQSLVAVGLCLGLTDVFFFQPRFLPFTGGVARASTLNLALVLIRFFGIFPPVILMAVSLESWLEGSALHIAVAAVAMVALHVQVVKWHDRRVAETAGLRELDDDEEEFPQRLGLRY